MFLRSVWCAASVALLLAMLAPSPTAAEESDWLVVEPGDRVVIIGNTLAERMQHDGYFETALQSRFPDKQLTVRNLGWSADEIDLRPRSAGFDDHGHTLADHDPDILLAMFGLNESFAGPAGLSAFENRFAKFLDETRQQLRAEAQLVVCSPIPHEDLGRAELPDGRQTNENIRLYSDVMRTSCQQAGVRFVDLFQPLQAALEAAPAPLTINGIHLTADGNEVLGAVLDASLFGPRPETVAANLEALRAAVLEKNLQFFYDHRAVNGYYIYGGRKNPYGVVNFPEEFAKLRNMIAVRDQRIWDLAQGKPVPDNIDDSQTGELSPIESNVTDEVEYLSPEQSKQQFVLADGFEIDLVVSEVDFPEMVNPVALDIDARGRLWVTTNPSYPQYLPGKPVDDKVLIYEDTSGDGRADKQTVFADGLHLPIGLALGDGGAYVSQQPDLMFLQDTTGDGSADHRRRILHGFDSADSHHALSAFTFGPDGALYFQEGTFHFTQVETPRGPQRVRDAAVFRYEPRTERFSIFVSYNFANPWGHCFDAWGQNFVADASPGANYFAAAFSGDVIYPHKRRQMQQFLVKQWRPTAACTIVSSRHFPESMQGNYLLNNTIGFLGTLNYRVSDEGSGFHGSPVDPLLSSRDPNFRPIDMKFGPDGALYIVDWFNPLIGHMQHNLRDPKRDKQHGRIWRVRHRETPLLEVPKIEGEPIADVVQLLERYENMVRHLARMELRLRDTDEVVAAIDAWLAQQNDGDPRAEHRRLEALWVMQHHDRVRPELLSALLASEDHRARAAATRVLSHWHDRVPEAARLLVDLAQDDSPRVRLEAVRAASFLDADRGRRITDAALAKPLDDYLNYTIQETTSTLDRRGGSRAASGGALVRRIVDGQAEQQQLVALTRAAGRDADAVQLGQLADAVLQGDYSLGVQAAALGELLVASQSRRLQASINVEAAARSLEAARRAGEGPLMVRIGQLAAAWNIPELTFPLRDLARDPAAPGEAIDAAMEALVTFRTPSAGDTRNQFRRDDLASDVRLRFARAMAASSAPQAADAIHEAIRSGIASRHGELLVRAAQAVLARSGGQQALAKALAQTEPDADTAKLLLRALFAAEINSGELVSQLRTAAGIGEATEPMTKPQQQALVQRVEAEGDPHRGQWVYRRKELNCIGCHVISGAGGIIGPDLSGVGANSPTEYLLESIVDPSAGIKEAWMTLQVLTVDGVVHRGVKVDRDDQRLLLRDENGRELIIAEDDIEQVAEGKSLMPEGLHHLITEEELIDLVAFLDALGKPGDFAVNDRPTVNRYDVLVDPTAAASALETAAEELAEQLAALPVEAWDAAFALVDGTLPAEALPATLGDAAVTVLRGHLDVTQGGKIAVEVNTDRPLRIVVGGQVIEPDGESPVELAAGRHSVHLVVEGPSEIGSLVTKILRPSGSSAQWTIIGGY